MPVLYDALRIQAGPRLAGRGFCLLAARPDGGGEDFGKLISPSDDDCSMSTELIASLNIVVDELRRMLSSTLGARESESSKKKGADPLECW